MTVTGSDFHKYPIIRPKYPPPRRPRVTIAIGMISRPKHDPPQIVLASDSQTTYPGGPKSLDTRKISIVRFNDDEILVAQSGSADLADKAIEIMQREAKGRNLDSEDVAPSIAEKALRQIRTHLKSINEGMITSEDGWKRLFREDCKVDLMLGYFFEEVPHLCTIDLDWSLPIPVKLNYKAIGIGANMGEHFLREYNLADPHFENAWPISVSVVEKVIDSVDGCGRPTWVGTLTAVQPEVEAHLKNFDLKYPRHMVTMLEREQIDDLASELKGLESKFVQLKRQQIEQTLREIFVRYEAEANEWRKKYLNEMKKQT
jgi:hypothetical protein